MGGLETTDVGGLGQLGARARFPLSWHRLATPPHRAGHGGGQQ